MQRSLARANVLEQIIAGLGQRTLDTAAGFGRFCIFSAYAISFVPLELVSRRGWGRFLPQCLSIGAMSVPVVLATGLFVGMVLIVQGWAQFEAAGLTDRLGAIVNITIAAELGPVLAGVMLAGRVGGALTAELGTMNITEQLLALRSMGADPVRFLVAPRFLGCLLLTPILTLYANVAGAAGAFIIYAGIYGGESEPYWRYIADICEAWDLGTGLIKALFFGGAIGMVSCYKGFHCKPGAEGVGQACTQAFVASFIVILTLDFFLNMVLNGLYGIWYGFRSVI
jgi:phospholipid/cholesterol/gamma-HCH transport system permease protein